MKIKFLPSVRVKLYLLALVIFIITSNNKSIAQSITFSTFTAPYVELTNDTSLNNGLIWEYIKYTIPSGFNFNFMGVSFSELNTWYTHGTLGVPLSGTPEYLVFSAIGGFLIDKAVDFSINNVGQPGSLSPISYVVDGTAGNRILKIQWKNAAFIEDYIENSMFIDSINYQVWFYEADSSLEYRYGPNFMSSIVYSTALGEGMEVGFYIYDTTSLEFDGYILDGNPVSPVLSQVFYDGNNTSPETDLNDTISNGTVYRFAPSIPNSISNSAKINNLRVFPNPTSGTINIANIALDKIRQIEIWNTIGQKSMELKPNTKLDISDLVPGIYSIRVITDDGIYVSKLQKD